jgi:hypothetical protein
MRRRVKFAVALLLLGLASAASGQTAAEQAAIQEWLQLDPRMLSDLAEGADSQGKQVRWLTLVEKERKLARTRELTTAKRRQRQLQREELGALARRLTETLELFAGYYEKYRLASSAVKSLGELRQFTRRIAQLTELIGRVYGLLGELPQLQPEELARLEGYLDGMVVQAERIVQGASLALIGEDTHAAELDALRAEHGAFFVLLRTVDRTEQLAKLNRQLSTLTLDLQRLVNYILFTAKQRAYATQDPDALRHLFGRD